MANDEELIVEKKEDVVLDDEFDIESFTYRENLESKSSMGQVTFIPVQSPRQNKWIFISSKPEWRCNVALIQENRESYLVRPELVPSLNGGVSHRMLVPYIDRDAAIFLWPIRVTDFQGKLNSWSTSALLICTQYADQWIKVKANMSSGSYEVTQAPSEIPSPEWPNGGLKFFLNRAFKNRTVNSLDDSIVKRMKGLI
ncbi:MAG: hypothetical protein ABSH06_25145 [Thermodesulfobacteriota bacterium]